MSKILILPGDGIGTEIVDQAVKVINSLNSNHEMGMTLVNGLIGGIAYDELDHLFLMKLSRQLRVVTQFY